MCKHQTEVYSRVVGYYRPVQQWNKGKQAEFKDRVAFDVSGQAFCSIDAKQADRENKVKSA